MRRSARGFVGWLWGTLALVVVALVTTSAVQGLIASNAQTSGSTAAPAVNTVGGFSVNKVHYVLDANPKKMDAVTFTLQSAVAGPPGTFGVSLDPSGTSVPQYICSTADSGTTWSCPTTSPSQATVRAATLLTVFEAGSGCAGCGKSISATGNMEGNLSIKTGDFIAAGFDFQVPGLPSATTVNVTFSNLVVKLPYTCAGGGGGAITVSFPQSTYTYAYTGNAGNAWLPTSSTADPSGFQAAPPPGVHAPNGCKGQRMSNSSATFSATVAWDLFLPAGQHPQVRFHYRVPEAAGQKDVNCANTANGQNPPPGTPACAANWSSAIDP